MPLGFHFGPHNYCSNYMISITIQQRHYPQTSLTELAMVEPHCPPQKVPQESSPSGWLQWTAQSMAGKMEGHGCHTRTAFGGAQGKGNDLKLKLNRLLLQTALFHFHRKGLSLVIEALRNCLFSTLSQCQQQQPSLPSLSRLRLCSVSSPTSTPARSPCPVTMRSRSASWTRSALSLTRMTSQLELPARRFVRCASSIPRVLCVAN